MPLLDCNSCALSVTVCLLLRTVEPDFPFQGKLIGFLLHIQVTAKQSFLGNALMWIPALSRWFGLMTKVAFSNSIILYLYQY